MTAAPEPGDIPPEAAEPFARGLDAYRAGDLSRAAGLFAVALAAAPDHPDISRLHGLALTRSGRGREALPFLIRARRLAWRDPLTHLHLGIGLLGADRPARAAAVLRRAVSMRPDDAAGWVNFSTALLAIGQAPAARAAARRALRAAPALGEAEYAFGRAALACGDPAGAANAFQSAVRHLPDPAPAWLNLGVARYRGGDTNGARAAMREAARADPTSADADANLAAFLLLEGSTDDALALLREALARVPGSVAARINLANTLLLERRPAEALAVLDGAPPTGPDGAHWRAHRVSALLELRHLDAARAELAAIAPPWGDAEVLVLSRRVAFASEDERAGLIERLSIGVAKETTPPEYRVIGHFNLATIYQRLGDRRQAFAHWISGHRVLRRFQPFSRDSFRRFIDASIAAFDAARMRGARAANQDPTPVFIVGMPRTGTTLMEQILAAHPRAYGAGERPDTHQLVVGLTGAAETAESARRLAGLDATALNAAARPFLASLRALAPDADRIIDKMPANARHLGFLSLMLPGARFILCRRDPRDVGLSIFQHRFFGYHPYAHDLSDLGFTIREQDRLMAHWRSVLGPRLLEVELTGWTDDFPATLRRVLDFVGLDYDPACERFHQQRRHVRTASIDQVRRPVNRAGIGRYREYEDFLQPLFVELEDRV